MNTQHINIGNIVRSILLIAIVLGIGISIGIGIARIGNAPSSVSQRVGQLDREMVVYDPGLRAVHGVRLNAAVLDRVAAEVLKVDSNHVHDSRLLV